MGGYESDQRRLFSNWLPNFISYIDTEFYLDMFWFLKENEKIRSPYIRKSNFQSEKSFEEQTFKALLKLKKVINGDYSSNERITMAIDFHSFSDVSNWAFEELEKNDPKSDIKIQIYVISQTNWEPNYRKKFLKEGGINRDYYFEGAAYYTSRKLVFFLLEAFRDSDNPKTHLTALENHSPYLPNDFHFLVP